ncbi:MAG: hypothetical protein HC768_19410 [Acaryochloris sp. CRU_2_0]|nr:hypothetical protein [Acaryochloris sp. CRU_2_0]
MKSENSELQEFTLSITWECVGQVKVRGENINDAFERYIQSFDELPPGEYVCDSLQHDYEGSLILNEQED